MQTITSEIGNGGQDVVFTEILALDDGTKLRVSIRSDSYAFQSYARVDRWDGAKWQRVHSIHYSQMATPPKLHYKRGERTAKEFRADRERLLDVAAAVLA